MTSHSRSYGEELQRSIFVQIASVIGDLESVIGISTPERSICFTKRHMAKTEPTLAEQIKLLNHKQLDLIVVEGFRDADIPKMEFHRSAIDKPYTNQTF